MSAKEDPSDTLVKSINDYIKTPVSIMATSSYKYKKNYQVVRAFKKDVGGYIKVYLYLMDDYGRPAITRYFQPGKDLKKVFTKRRQVRSFQLVGVKNSLGKKMTTGPLKKGYHVLITGIKEKMPWIYGEILETTEKSIRIKIILSNFNLPEQEENISDFDLDNNTLRWASDPNGEIDADDPSAYAKEARFMQDLLERVGNNNNIKAKTAVLKYDTQYKSIENDMTNYLLDPFSYGNVDNFINASVTKGGFVISSVEEVTMEGAENSEKKESGKATLTPTAQPKPAPPTPKKPIQQATTSSTVSGNLLNPDDYYTYVSPNSEMYKIAITFGDDKAQDPNAQEEDVDFSMFLHNGVVQPIKYEFDTDRNKYVAETVYGEFVNEEHDFYGKYYYNGRIKIGDTIMINKKKLRSSKEHNFILRASENQELKKDAKYAIFIYYDRSGYANVPQVVAIRPVA